MPFFSVLMLQWIGWSSVHINGTIQLASDFRVIHRVSVVFYFVFDFHCFLPIVRLFCNSRFDGTKRTL